MADIDQQNLSIPKFYAGRHIFITGGSGFIGKVLVEKLLRSCPDVAGLHLLLRKKKGVSPADRLKTITQIPLFDILRKENPNFEEKLNVVSGDISLLGLGLDPQSRQFLVEKVSIIYHAAATVRFNDPLTKAIKLNVGGTQEVALLAKEMPNLTVFVHVSTTYCNTDRKVIEEKLHPPHGDWRTLLKATEKLDPKHIGLVGLKIQSNLPNTYTFTKSLAEHCVSDVLEGKPPVIVRPSVVISTISEPIKGWIDNFNGPVGLLVAAGKGIHHISLASNETTVDYVPVDVVVKVLLIAAFKHGSIKFHDSVPVYNCSSAAQRPVTMGEMRDYSRKSSTVYPLNDMLWIPSEFLTTNRFVFLLGTILLHMIPAAIFDVVLRLKGQKPSLAKLQRIIYIAQDTLAPFTLNSWVFKNDKMLLLDQNVPAEDINAFSFDFLNESYDNFSRWTALGARRYLLKEGDESLPAARRHRQRMILIKIVATFFEVALVTWFLFQAFVRRLMPL